MAEDSRTANGSISITAAPLALNLDSLQSSTGGANIETPVSTTSGGVDFEGLEHELVNEDTGNTFGVLERYKQVKLHAAIKQRGGGEDDYDSDSLETDDESEHEPSFLGDEPSVVSRTISESDFQKHRSDAPVEMPTVGVPTRYTLHRNDSMVNEYFRKLQQDGGKDVAAVHRFLTGPAANGLPIHTHFFSGGGILPITDDSEDGSVDLSDLPDWISSMPTEKRSSIFRSAQEGERSRAQTTEELQEAYKLTTEQAEEVIEIVNSSSNIKFDEDSEPVDLICTIERDMWKPIDSSFEYPVFDKEKNELLNLRVSGEFFRYMRRGFTEKKMLVETELPDLQTWTAKTYKMFSFKEKNRVTSITEALVAALQSTEILSEFLEYSCIILEEPVDWDSKVVQYGDLHFGSRAFTLGKHSIVNARVLFSFTSQKFSFRDEVWEEALETVYPGRQLMMEPVFVGEGVKEEIKHRTQRFDSLMRLHNLFISDYIKSIQIVGFMNLRSRGKRHPLEFSYQDLYNNQNVDRKMEKPLKDGFGKVCYCVNPDPPKHIPDMLKKYKSLKTCRMMCDTVGWLHTLLYLLDQRIESVFKLDAACRNWLAKKKPKKQNSKKKSKTRLAVEELLNSTDKERGQLTEMINSLPKNSQFEDLYAEEDRVQREEMLRMAKNSTNASKRLSKRAAKSSPTSRDRNDTPDSPAQPAPHPPPDVKTRSPRQSKLDEALFKKRIDSTHTINRGKKSKKFRLGTKRES